MAEQLQFTASIKDIKYKAYLTKKLCQHNFTCFNINTASSYGTIKHGDAEVGFSKWVSPKRTRSYPFERIYNTLNCSKIITVIPIIKDEGIDGDIDKIQFSTLSWMNLLNVYVVLAYYSQAEQSTKDVNKRKITNQKFDKDFVNAQIEEIFAYKQSALHWNNNLFESRFTSIFDSALKAYQSISQSTGVKTHPQDSLFGYLENIKADYSQFKDLSSRASKGASLRELQTSHALEKLSKGEKAQLLIENYLGGIYYLTADEIIIENKIFILQESKNSSTAALPSASNIKDGLFKLILYSNIHTLSLDGQPISFKTRLRITGTGISGTVKFPCSRESFEYFLKQNALLFKPSQANLLRMLWSEVKENDNFELEIEGNT
jgi:hypothetical protein